MNILKECARDLLPFFLQGKCRSFPFRSPIPVIGIPNITFFAMEVGMDVRCTRVRKILNTGMRCIPIASMIVPHGL